MNKLILLSSFIILASPAAHAGIYLEPYVGYEMSKTSGSVDVASFGVIDVDQSGKGAVFGAKAGYSMMGFALGVDYSQFNSKDKDNTGQDEDSDSKVADLGGFVQFTFPIMFKVSATYIFSSKSESDTTEFSGTGFKIGAGYTGLPFISINVDYISIAYDDATDPDLTFNTVDVKSTATMLSVSLPLDF